jgi:hypothetical protein
MPYANQALSFESGLFPGEADKFLVAKITGVEKMSGLFEFQIQAPRKSTSILRPWSATRPS